jgi:DNA-binding NarL/FixJ family response regulator
MSLSIVIVDDDPAFRAVACSLLAARGFTVLAQAGDLSSGLTAIAEHNPDAVLLDLQMPDSDGLTASPSIHRVSPDARILLTSAGERVPSESELATAGVTAFLPKERLATTDLTSLLWP